MSEYIPTTARMREIHGEYWDDYRLGEAEFDRWLEQVKADAYLAGREAMREEALLVAATLWPPDAFDYYERFSRTLPLAPEESATPNEATQPDLFEMMGLPSLPPFPTTREGGES